MLLEGWVVFRFPPRSMVLNRAFHSILLTKHLVATYWYSSSTKCGCCGWAPSSRTQPACHDVVLLCVWWVERAPHTAANGTCIDSAAWTTCLKYWISWLGQQVRAPTIPHRDYCWLHQYSPVNPVLNPTPQKSRSPSTPSYKSFHPDNSHNPSTCSTASSNRPDCTTRRWSYYGRLPYPPASTAPVIALHASSAPARQMHLHSWALWWLLDLVQAASNASLTFRNPP